MISLAMFFLTRSEFATRLSHISTVKSVPFTLLSRETRRISREISVSQKSSPRENRETRAVGEIFGRARALPPTERMAATPEAAAARGTPGTGASRLSEDEREKCGNDVPGCCSSSWFVGRHVGAMCLTCGNDVQNDAFEDRIAGGDDDGNVLYAGAVFDEVAVSLKEKGFTPLDIDGVVIKDFGHRKDRLSAHRLQGPLRARGLLVDEATMLSDSTGERHPKAKSKPGPGEAETEDADGRGRLYGNSCAALLKGLVGGSAWSAPHPSDFAMQVPGRPDVRDGLVLVVQESRA